MTTQCLSLKKICVNHTNLFKNIKAIKTTLLTKFLNENRFLAILFQIKF